MTQHQHQLDAGTEPAGSLDEGGRLLAATVLAAAGRGDRSAIAELTAPLDVDQLRALVATVAVQVDQVMPDQAASGPAAVCELAINASAPLFGVTPEAILSPQRSRPISDARAVAMTAARENGLSLPAIAEQFGKDHGSVIHAVRRTQQRPRLQTRPLESPNTSATATPSDCPDPTPLRQPGQSRPPRPPCPSRRSSHMTWSTTPWSPRRRPSPRHPRR